MIRKHVRNGFRISAALFLILCLAPLAASAEAESPKAVVTETTYEFEPVYEGRAVMHAFTIENKGDAVLDIENVRAG